MRAIDGISAILVERNWAIGGGIPISSIRVITTWMYNASCPPKIQSLHSELHNTCCADRVTESRACFSGLEPLPASLVRAI